MKMSKYYNKVKKYYDSGLWSIIRVRSAVKKKWITEEEFELITDEPYSSSETVSETENE